LRKNNGAYFLWRSRGVGESAGRSGLLSVSNK